jgi:hypothetical protein
LKPPLAALTFPWKAVLVDFRPVTLVAAMIGVLTDVSGCGGAAHNTTPSGTRTVVSVSSGRPPQESAAQLTTGPVLAFGYLPNGRGFDIRGGNATDLPSQAELSAGVAGAGASRSAIAAGDQSGGSASLVLADVRGPMPFSGVFACSGQPKVFLLFGLLRATSDAAYLKEGRREVRFVHVPLADSGVMSGYLVYAPVSQAATILVAHAGHIVLRQSLGSAPSQACAGPGTPMLLTSTHKKS